MTVTITSGAHWRNTAAIPPGSQFAHRFDADEPEDVPHQANNFLTYANALGISVLPHVVYMPPLPDDPAEAAHIRVEVCDWTQIVATATGAKVEIR